MKRILIVLVVLLAAGGLAWWQLGGNGTAAPAYTTAPAERGDLERTVTALGTLKPLEYVDVGAQVSGQIDRLLVEAGDMVKANQLLAEIDPTVYLARVEADRADLAGLEAQLAERMAQLKLARAQHGRQAALLKADATSREAYDSAAAAVEVAEAQIAALRAGIAQAQSTLDADEANLGYTQIRAPMAGTVMSLTARQGQTINANQQAPTILQIADLQTMTVWTQVSEADVSKLSVGMDAYFTTLGQPDRRWQGTLRQILPTPEVVNNVVLFNALFDVANPDGALMPQMTAQVFFVVDRAQDAVLVPVAALRPGEGRGAAGGDGKSIVQVMTERGIEDRAVTVGIQNRVSAVIVEGLQPGEEVVIGRAEADPDGEGGNMSRAFRMRL
jgi:macrolide-specific efflux system membrane fusion protein